MVIVIKMDSVDQAITNAAQYLGYHELRPNQFKARCVPYVAHWKWKVIICYAFGLAVCFDELTEIGCDEASA